MTAMEELDVVLSVFNSFMHSFLSYLLVTCIIQTAWYWSTFSLSRVVFLRYYYCDSKCKPLTPLFREPHLGRWARVGRLGGKVNGNPVLA
jgi:hypothetical protein